MASITDKLKKTKEALEGGKLRKALLLTDTPKLDRQHGFIVEAAESCLADKDNKEACDKAIKTALDKVVETMTLPEDSTDLEGIEDYMRPREESMPEETVKVEVAETVKATVAEDETPFCGECLIAGAIGQFGEISDACDGSVRKKLEEMSQDANTPPEKWLKTMTEIAEAETCNREAYASVLSGLTDELKKNNSEILKRLD